MKLIDLEFIQKILDKFGLVLVGYFYDENEEVNYPRDFPYQISIHRKSKFESQFK